MAPKHPALAKCAADGDVAPPMRSADSKALRGAKLGVDAHFASERRVSVVLGEARVDAEPSPETKKKVAAAPPASRCDAGTPTRSNGAKTTEGPKETAAMRSVGLDLGSRKISFCEVSNGKVVARATVSRISDLLDRLGPGQPDAWVAIEASRAAWAVHAELEGWGNKVSMLDTTRVRQMGIGQHGKKNDTIDAERMALAVEQRRLPEAHVLSEDRQQLRHLVMTRRTLVESRSTLVTTVRGLATSLGCALPRCESASFAAMMSGGELPDRLRQLASPLLAVFLPTEAKLRELDVRLEEICARDPLAQKLMTAPGVGPVVASMFISVIDGAHRFGNARQVTSYLGLVPRENSSGSSGQRLGAITKQGNPYLRSLLVQSAWVLMRKSNIADPLARWGLAVAERRGRKIAAIAVARRLAAILWAMWKRDVAYDPAHVAELSAGGLALSAAAIAGQAEAMQRSAAKAKERRSRLATREKKSAALAARGVPMT